jgi:hypothetical protein
MDSNMNKQESSIWNIPYIDQPVVFWEKVKDRYGRFIKEVYVPVSDSILPSGRPVQPSRFLNDFMEYRLFNINILINPVVLMQPAEKIAATVTDNLKKLYDSYAITSCTLTNITLAERIKHALPDMKITASVLMDISGQGQLSLIGDIFDTIVPSSRILRNLPTLQTIRKSFRGRIRLIVNEGCLPGCPFRTQHFFEMGSKLDYPESLCKNILAKNPWLRLTGSWILPQHLYMFNGLYDELKISGRVTLQNSNKFMKILGAYISRKNLQPHEIGGGPASLLLPLNITDAFYKSTLTCSHQCYGCNICEDYYKRQLEEIS